MPVTVTNIDPNTGIIKRGPFQDILLTSAGATTYKANTLLAVDSVSLKAVPFVKGGSTNENGIPKMLLTYEVTVAGAGDTKVRAMMTGEIRKDKTVIHADGDASNIDQAVKDLCKDQGLVLVDVKDLQVADNQ